jgi:hypothetical protein
MGEKRGVWRKQRLSFSVNLFGKAGRRCRMHPWEKRYYVHYRRRDMQFLGFLSWENG